MPNATNLVVRRDDGTDITLVPVSSNNEGGVTMVRFRELSAVKPLTACIRAVMMVEELKSGVTKITRKLEVPVMEIIPAGAVNSDGRVAAPEIAHVLTDIRTWYTSPRATPTERADALRMANHIDAGATSTTSGGVSPFGVDAFTYRDVASSKQLPYGIINFVWPSA